MQSTSFFTQDIAFTSSFHSTFKTKIQQFTNDLSARLGPQARVEVLGMVEPVTLQRIENALLEG